MHGMEHDLVPSWLAGRQAHWLACWIEALARLYEGWKHAYKRVLIKTHVLFRLAQ